MGIRGFQSFILLIVLLCSGSSDSKAMVGAIEHHNRELDHKDKQLLHSSSTSTTQKDVTTPITTVPLINPTTPTTTPLVNPIATPTPPTITNPISTPTTTSPVSPGGSWCVASPSASETALQVALDYACGYGGADCSVIQQGGSCYNPSTVRDHASYAFNQYYQKNPVPTSCNFGGTAVITNTDPSSGTCQYPSTSTTSSVLNTTNPSGSTVYGSQPTTNSAVSMSCSRLLLFSSTFLLVSLLTVNHL